MQYTSDWALERIVRDLSDDIRAIVRRPRVQMFYLGRGVDPIARMYEHGAHEVVPLHRTRSVEIAIDIEAALIQRFIDHHKNDNDVADGRGGRPVRGSTYIYLALWTAT